MGSFAPLSIGKDLFFAVWRVETEEPLSVNRTAPEMSWQQFVRFLAANQSSCRALRSFSFSFVLVRRAGVIADGAEKHDARDELLPATPTEVVDDLLAPGGMADEEDMPCAALSDKIDRALEIVEAIAEYFVGDAGLFPHVSLFRAGLDFLDSGNAIVTTIAEEEYRSVAVREWKQVVVMSECIGAEAMNENDGSSGPLRAEPETIEHVALGRDDLYMAAGFVSDHRSGGKWSINSSGQRHGAG